MQAIEAGTELERRLALYARARLSPDPAATARTKARVMREARLSFEAARIAVHVAPALAASRASVRRRMVMPFLAAAVWLAIGVGTMSAAQPGGPLYPTRMWIETAALPTSLAPRTAAELDRLDARIAEALAGVARGDRGAVAAALDAYNQIAEETTAMSGGSPELEALIAEALGQHVDVLTAVAARLADKGNTTASEAIERNIERAIERNAAVMEGLHHDRVTPQGGTDGAGGTGTSGSGSGGQSGGDGAGGGGSAGHTQPPKPAASPNASRPPAGVDKPVRTPKPDADPQSDRSPRG